MASYVYRYKRQNNLRLNISKLSNISHYINDLLAIQSGHLGPICHISFLFYY